jgi:hypothetical protein
MIDRRKYMKLCTQKSAEQASYTSILVCFHGSNITHAMESEEAAIAAYELCKSAIDTCSSFRNDTPTTVEFATVGGMVCHKAREIVSVAVNPPQITAEEIAACAQEN